MAFLLGCTATEKIGTLPPGGPIPQLGLSPVTVNFVFSIGGAAPPSQVVSLSASPGQIDGLNIGTILYTPISSGWLAADFGTGGPNTPTTVVLTANPPADLLPGSYVATVPVSSTVSGVTTQFIVATLTVNGAPDIELSPQSVSLNVTQGGANPAPQYVDVSNAGAGTLSGLSVGTIAYGGGGSGWLTATLDAATAPATMTLQVSHAGLATGTYTAQVPVRTTLAGVAPDTVLVSLGVSATSTPPTIVVSPVTVPVAAIVGGANPAPQLVSVANGGGGTLAGLAVGTITYGAGAQGWLTAVINQTVAPAQISLQARTGTLQAGTFTATVRVTSTQAGVASRTFTVAFTLAAVPQAPVINLAPAAPAFTATVGGANPVTVPVSVTNGGGGSLSQLSLGTITYGPGAIGWLSASLSNTTAPATITLSAQTGALAAGTYTATVPVLSATAGVVPQNISATFTVVGQAATPMIGLAPTDATFGAQAGGANPAARVVQVTNAGGGSLDGLAVGAISYVAGGSPGWLTATLNTTTAPATITLQAITGTLAAGTYRALVPVTSAVAGNSPRNIGVRFDVAGAPGMTLAPTSVIFTGTTGQPSPAPATIAISGTTPLTGITAGPVAYGVGQPTGWLSTSLSSGTTPATLVLAATTGSLVAGTYSATVPVATTTPGVPAQAVTVNFQVGVPSGGLVLIQGDDQTGLVGGQLATTLVARIFDAAGLPKPGVTVLWQVNNGGSLGSVVSTSNATGDVSAKWTLGPLAGLHTVSVSSAGLPTLIFTADAQLPPNPGARPNEPAGFVAFAEHNMSSLPSYPRSLGGLMGSWYTFPLNNPNLIIVTPDLTAPESPPNTVRSRFPAGLSGGQGPVTVAGWDAAGKVAAGQKSKVYLSMWLKIEGTDYENQAFGTKMGFMASALPTSGAGTQAYFLLAGNGSQTPASAFNVNLHQETGFAATGGFTRILGQNVNRAKVMTVGAWHQWEAVFEMNTLGQADGKFQWWVDGSLVCDYRDVVYQFNNNTNGFWEWKWNPTWGGTAGQKTRADNILIDHVYLSGVP